LGFISYTFLPALGLIFCLMHIKSKLPKWIILLIPISYSLIALFKQNFVVESFCGTYFVSTRYILFDAQNPLIGNIYLAYYSVTIVLIFYLLLKHHSEEKDKTQKGIDLLAMSAMIISLIPALLLMVIFPMLKIQFPSIYCHFAIAFAICVLIALVVEKKGGLKKEFSKK
jgi:hypothetical protein